MIVNTSADAQRGQVLVLLLNKMLKRLLDSYKRYKKDKGFFASITPWITNQNVLVIDN